MPKKHKRGFLNAREGLACYEYNVWDSYAEFTIRDCERTITLEFRLETNRRSSVKKAEKLIRALEAFREAIDV